MAAWWGAKELDRGLLEEVRIQLLETVVKVGYVREGVMRRSVIKEGIVLDQALYAITDQDLASLGQFGRNRSLLRTATLNSRTNCL